MRKNGREKRLQHPCFLDRSALIGQEGYVGVCLEWNLLSQPSVNWESLLTI